MFPSRRAPYLCANDRFSFVPGSVVAVPFSLSDSVRQGIVTASGASGILGIGYDSRYKNLYKLSGKKDADEVVIPGSYKDNALKHGKKYEKQASEIFCKLFESELSPLGTIEEQYSYQATFANNNVVRFKISCTPDLILFDHKKKKSCLLEIKCPYTLWTNQTEPSLTQMNPSYYTQCQFQMLVMAIESCFLMVYVPKKEGEESTNYVIWKISRDPDFQTFLLSNVFQVNQELNYVDNQRKIWSARPKEKDYNFNICLTSSSIHSELFTVNKKI